MRTLEEIGELFGDTHVASHWYTLSAEERERIAAEAAMDLTDSGDIKHHEKTVTENQENVSTGEVTPQIKA